MAQKLLTDQPGVTDLITFFDSFLTDETGGEYYAKFIDLLLKVLPDCEYSMPTPGLASDTRLKGTKTVNYSERMAFDAGQRQGADAAVRRIQEIGQAERDTRSVVGELPPQPTAAGVYRMALRQLGHDVAGLADGAMRDIFMNVRHGGRRSLAMDSATTTDLEKLVGPGVSALKRR